MRWTEILLERGEPYLYHSTPAADDAAKIIYENIIKAFTSHRADLFGLTNPNGDEYVNGVSLTRSYDFAHRWKSGNGALGTIVFALDGAMLKTRYRVKPFDYYQSRGKHRDIKARSEAEEFCITKVGITPLDRYLREIRISKAYYDYCVEQDMEDYGATDHPDAMYSLLIHHPLLKII